MLAKKEISRRLKEMENGSGPRKKWDETCAGSARSLVVFLGPSPGGPAPKRRRPINKDRIKPLWNKPFDEPTISPKWSRGFHVSFAPLVEEIIGTPFARSGKLVGRANLDWISEPNSSKVAKKNMLKGMPSVLEMIEDCQPEVILSMGWDAHRAFREGLRSAGWSVSGWKTSDHPVTITPKPKKRVHKTIWGYDATSPSGRILRVVKLPQHPARIYREDYARRCGEAVRAVVKGK